MRWKLVSSVAAVIAALSTPLAAQTNAFVVTLAPAPVDTSVSANWPAKRAQLLDMIDRDVKSLKFDGRRLRRRPVHQATVRFNPASFMLRLTPARGTLLLQMDAPKKGNCPKAERLRQS